MVEINLPKILQPFYCHDIVRLGKNNDGGYLVNIEDIKKTDLLLSFGIGTDISFEKDFVNMRKCPMEAFDKEANISDIDFFNSTRKLITKNIGVTDDEYTVSVNSILSRISGQIFLKCDIEGYEYNLFDIIIENRTRFSGIVIEVHDIAQYENFNIVTDFISKLGMPLLHTHINNNSYYDHGNSKYTPNVLELTFTSSYNTILKRDLRLPHQLDMPCNLERPDFSTQF